MKLNQALAILKQRKQDGPPRLCFLACGCEPLHLSTFLQAHLLEQFPDDRVEVATGLYGDLFGNLGRAMESSAGAAAVALEWGDLDPRWGLRSSGGWTRKSQRDILETSHQRLASLVAEIETLAQRMPVAIAPPMLPLVPIGVTRGAQASELELGLESHLADSLEGLAHTSSVRVLQRSHLQAALSGASPFDPKMELVAGFPYTLAYASAVAKSWVEVLYPKPPKKGLITDLDGTLWSGIVGEVGVENICWTQERHAQVHGLYQQMLGHLAECGVLIAACSKNEATVVQEALRRKDLLLDSEALFPVCADWNPKSASVREILRAWNIGEGDVVFVDDSAMELSEVKRAFPGITCLQFPANDPAEVWNLLAQLRDMFGKPQITEEDGLRLASIRSWAWTRKAEQQSTSPDFLRSLQGTITIDYRKSQSDGRALELINKTNQFNLNGLRMSQGEWQACLRAPENIVAVVSYQDKFGPLGRIATVVGKQAGERLQISHWVMSCRAFSRRLEHHTLDSLFRQSNVQELVFDFQSTERNQPLREFFQQIGICQNGSGVWRLSRSQFLERADELPHQASDIAA
jgi:FkbH-like protein